MLKRSSRFPEHLSRTGLVSSRGRVLSKSGRAEEKERFFLQTPREEVELEIERTPTTILERETIQRVPPLRGTRRPRRKTTFAPTPKVKITPSPTTRRKSLFAEPATRQALRKTRRKLELEREGLELQQLEELRKTRRELQLQRGIEEVEEKELAKELRKTKRELERSKKEWTVDVENELIELGYAPISKIVVTKGGEFQGKYIKARNKYGQYVYIELDTEGVVSIAGREVTHLEQEVATETPYGTQLEAFKCAGSDVCGMAFECKGGVCTLTKEERERAGPRRTSFIVAERNQDITAFMVGDEVAYPVVRLSEIRANPLQSLEAQNTATVRMRNQSYQNIVDETNELAEALNQLTVEFNSFNDLRERLTADVNADFVALDTLNVSFLENPPQGEAEREQYTLLLKELKRRNDVVIDILKCSANVADYRKTIRKMIDEISEAKKQCLENVEL